MDSYVTDGTTAILIGCLPLILPQKNPLAGILIVIKRWISNKNIIQPLIF